MKKFDALATRRQSWKDSDRYYAVDLKTRAYAPQFMYNLFDRLEKILKPFSSVLAFRIFVALEKI